MGHARAGEAGPRVRAVPFGAGPVAISVGLRVAPVSGRRCVSRGPGRVRRIHAAIEDRLELAPDAVAAVRQRSAIGAARADPDGLEVLGPPGPTGHIAVPLVVDVGAVRRAGPALRVAAIPFGVP